MNPSFRSLATISYVCLALGAILFSPSFVDAMTIGGPSPEKETNSRHTASITLESLDGGAVIFTPNLNPTPLLMTTYKPVISAGGYHTCAVTPTEGVKCWGDNMFGELGDGTTTNRMLPTQVNLPVAGVLSVVAGTYHTCALISNGEVYCWGRNDKGQLGDGSAITRNTPVRVVGLGEAAIAIDAGFLHTCALMSSWVVKCWGDNTYGQLGDGTNLSSANPVDVLNLSGASAIATGGDHTCALLSAGTVDCWGKGDYGQLGDANDISRNFPLMVKGLTGVTELSAGYDHTCAVVSGIAKCWGLNDHFQLGDGTNTNHATPVGVLNLPGDVTSIEAGDTHTCVLGTNGWVSCWGKNTYGQIGDQSTVDRQIPYTVIDSSMAAYALSAGASHTCALTLNSGGMCWGNNASGELGIGSLESQTVPVAIPLFRSDAPVLVAISPPAIQAGTSGATVVLSGTGFEAGDLVALDGLAQITTFIDSTRLSTQINVEAIQKVGVGFLTVGHLNAIHTSNSLDLQIYTFADVLPGEWSYRYVEGFFAKGITTGCNVAPFRYCPDRAVTRAEMAVFILRSIHSDALPYTPNPAQTGVFADVPVTGKEWMQPWIEEFYGDGYTTGCGYSGSTLLYCPERQVTRAEMAVFVLRAIHGASYQPPAVTVSSFSDVPVAGKEWMMPWMEEFYVEGLTTGCKQTPTLQYCPEQSVTRAEMATFMDRAFSFPQLP